MRLVLTVALGIAVGCGPGPGDQTVRGEATLETFVNRMCACADPTCASAVVGDFAHWTKLLKKPRDNTGGSNGENDARRLMDRYNACMKDANARTSH